MPTPATVGNKRFIALFAILRRIQKNRCCCAPKAGLAAIGPRPILRHLQRQLQPQRLHHLEQGVRAGRAFARQALFNGFRRPVESCIRRLKYPNPGRDFLGQSARRHPHVVLGLQIHPEPWRHVEKQAEPQSRIRSDRSVAIDQITDAAG